MSVSRRPQGRGDFEIAVICALPIECDAVEALFDEFWEDDQTYGKAPGDPNAYSTQRSQTDQRNGTGGSVPLVADQSEAS
jgi:hypothetical protein